MVPVKMLKSFYLWNQRNTNRQLKTHWRILDVVSTDGSYRHILAKTRLPADGPGAANRLLILAVRRRCAQYQPLPTPFQIPESGSSAILDAD